jgi:sulfatase-modifying factor enzyme 1
MGAAGLKLAIVLAAWLCGDIAPLAARPACPDGMAFVHGFCIDRWEDQVVELDVSGAERPHSPYLPVDGLEASILAKTAPAVVPQGYISQVQSAAACAHARKRLCSEKEFGVACRGTRADDIYPYGGSAKVPGYCNEGKGSMLPIFFGAEPSRWTFADLNDARLNQIDGGLAPTGAYARCESSEGIWDCVGNLHEWTSDPPDASGHGRLRGGFYGDAERNGRGCRYVTTAHAPTYHDYSTGFRCCADPLALDPDPR